MSNKIQKRSTKNQDNKTGAVGHCCEPVMVHLIPRHPSLHLFHIVPTYIKTHFYPFFCLSVVCLFIFLRFTPYSAIRRQTANDQNDVTVKIWDQSAPKYKLTHAVFLFSFHRMTGYKRRQQLK